MMGLVVSLGVMFPSMLISASSTMTSPVQAMKHRMRPCLGAA